MTAVAEKPTKKEKEKAPEPEPVADVAKPGDTLFDRQFYAARMTSTPIVAIATPDPAATVVRVHAAKKKSGEPLLTEIHPGLMWDAVKGLRGINDEGSKAVASLGIEAKATRNLVEALDQLSLVPRGAYVFIQNAHRYLDNPQVLQAVWNLRDLFKKNQRTLILLGIAFHVPPEIAGDIVVLDEPLPTRPQLAHIFEQQHKNANVEVPTDEAVCKQALDALIGLPAYTAEAVTAMSIGKAGIDMQILWERKIKAIENNNGMRVWRGKENIDDLKGLDAVMGFAQRLVDADAFGAIVFMDEVEKAMAGGMSDYVGDSGVSKDQVGVLLSYIEDTRSMGVLFAGIAGCGKTQLAKAIAYLAGKPLIMFDLGGMKGGTVGQSERTIRNNLKVVSATAEGRVLFLATANKTASFSPEWNRRFADQWFFDLLPDAARPPVWKVYAKKNGLTPEQVKIPQGFDAGWTGAEIKRVCERATMFKCSVRDAAKYLVPMAVSAKEAIAQLRQQAHGHFLSASYDGWYVGPKQDIEKQQEIARQIEVE